FPPRRSAAGNAAQRRRRGFPVIHGRNRRAEAPWPSHIDLTMTLSLDFTTGSNRAALAARALAPEKPPLIGLTRAELAEALVSAGIVPERQAKMRAQQLW